MAELPAGMIENMDGLPFTEADQDALLKTEPLLAGIGPITGFCLIGQLQLALRHPQNTTRSAKVARVFLNDLIEHFAVTPNLRAILMAGFDPKYDFEPNTKSDVDPEPIG